MCIKSFRKSSHFRLSSALSSIGYEGVNIVHAAELHIVEQRVSLDFYWLNQASFWLLEETFPLNLQLLSGLLENPKSSDRQLRSRGSCCFNLLCPSQASEGRKPSRSSALSLTCQHDFWGATTIRDHDGDNYIIHHKQVRETREKVLIPLQVWVLAFDKNTKNIINLKTTTALLQFRIKIEDYWSQRKILVLYFCCQANGHKADFCHLMECYLKSTGSHSIRDCSKISG